MGWKIHAEYGIHSLKNEGSTIDLSADGDLEISLESGLGYMYSSHGAYVPFDLLKQFFEANGYELKKKERPDGDADAAVPEKAR